MCYAQDPQTLEQNGPLYTKETGEDTLSLYLKNPQKDCYIAAVKDITDRNGAEALRGTQLYINRDELPETNEDEYYYEDLIGKQVFDYTEKNIGKVITVNNFGASDLLEIKPQSEDSFFLPFTESYIQDIDYKNNRINLNNTAYDYIKDILTPSK